MPIEESKTQNQQSSSFDTALLDSSYPNTSTTYPFDKPANLHNSSNTTTTTDFSNTNTSNFTDSSMSSMPTTDQSWVHSTTAQPEFSSIHDPLQVPSHQQQQQQQQPSTNAKIEQSDKPYPHREAHSSAQHYLTPDTSAQVLASVVDPNLGTPVSSTGLGPNPYPIGVNSGQTEPAWLHPVQDDKDFDKESTQKPSHMSKLLHLVHHDKNEGQQQQQEEGQDKDKNSDNDKDQDKEKHKHKKHEKHHKHEKHSDKSDDKSEESKEGFGKKIGNWVSNTLDDVKASVGGIAHMTEKPADPDRVHEEHYSVDKAPEGKEPSENDEHAHLGLPLQRGKFD